MADFEYPNLTVQGRLVPDTPSEASGGAGGAPESGADAFELGVEIGGVWVPFYHRRSAAGLLADIERVKASQPEPTAQPAQPAPAQPQSPQPAQPSQPPQQ